MIVNSTTETEKVKATEWQRIVYGIEERVKVFPAFKHVFLPFSIPGARKFWLCLFDT